MEIYKNTKYIIKKKKTTLLNNRECLVKSEHGEGDISGKKFSVKAHLWDIKKFVAEE